MRGVNEVLIGTAGWAIPRTVADAFPAEGSQLERYAARFSCAEINSSFHRPHRPATYARWAAGVPEEFRFAVKLPKTISHERRLLGCEDLVARFLEESAGLGARLGVLLLQLPPSLVFDAEVAASFFAVVRDASPADVACEPRHASWFTAEADAMLAVARVARVAADPVRAEGAGAPGGWRGLGYHRLHGSPRTYYSSYDDGRLEGIADALRGEAGPVWCVFDNTASGAATGDALALTDLLRSSP